MCMQHYHPNRIIPIIYTLRRAYERKGKKKKGKIVKISTELQRIHLLQVLFF